MDVDAVSRFFGVLAFVAGAGALVLVALRHHPATAALRARATAVAGGIATTAMLGSLWYSESVGFVPCELCWYQRIPMYALAVLLVVAAVRRDDAIRPYARILAGIGLALSAWHVAVQRVPALAGSAGCSADAPCTAMWVEAFGVFTIPTMAGSGFLAILVLTSVRSPDTAAARPSAQRDAGRTPALTE